MQKRMQSLPWCGGALLQGGGSAGSISEGTLRGHHQGEGDTGFTGALAVRVWHRHRVDTTTYRKTQKITLFLLCSQIKHCR